MTPKRMILIVLTSCVALLISLTLVSSWTQPQAQNQLSLYQTDLVLQASVWSGQGQSQAGLGTQGNPFLGEDPVQAAINTYEDARQSAQKGMTQLTAASASRLEQAVDSERTQSSLQRDLEQRRSTMASLNLRLGVLYASAGQTERAITIWTELLEIQDSLPSVSPIIQAAEVLLQLWSPTPQLLPQAQPLLEQQLTGWFRYQALSQLYKLQQRQDALLEIEAQAQQAATSALLRLVVVGVLPIFGCVMGVGILLVWWLQAYWGHRRSPERSERPLTASSLDPSPRAMPPSSLSSQGSPAAPAPSTSPLTSPLSLTQPHRFVTAMIPRFSQLDPQAELARSVFWSAETVWQVMVVWFTAFFLVSLLMQLGGQLLGLRFETFDARAQAYVAFANYSLLMVIGFSILYVSLQPYVPPLRWLKLRWKGYWLAWGTSGYLSALPLVIVVSLLNQQLMQNQGGSNPLLEMIVQNRDPLTVGLLGGMVMVMAPLFEEILFRGFFLTSLTRYLPMGAAIALSALLFAIAHLNLADILPLTVLGFVLGAVYVRSRNLLSSMLLHSLWNSGSFLGLLILGSSSG